MARDGERDPETEPVVPIPAALQDPGRVHRRDHEADHHVGREDHVRGLIQRGPVEKDLPRIDRHDPPVAEREPAR